MDMLKNQELKQLLINYRRTDGIAKQKQITLKDQILENTSKLA